MHVQFQATADELVDVHLRSLALSREERVSRSGYRFWLPLLLGAVVALLVPGDALARQAIGFAVWAACFALYPWWYRTARERRVRALCRQYLDGRAEFPVEIRTDPIGLHVRQRSEHITHPWESITGIEETPAAIYVTMDAQSILAVRPRAFQNAEQQQRFVDLAREFAAHRVAAAHLGGRGYKGGDERAAAFSLPYPACPPRAAHRRPDARRGAPYRGALPLPPEPRRRGGGADGGTDA